MEKKTIPQAESRSADLVKENLEQLKQIFPEVIKEGRVDLEALHDLLGSYADTAEERFGLNWAGKANARREAQKRSTGTLRPCPEESVDWDTTENLYIEGDNLEVLKLLQKSYHKQVKMIYIDPPYNTGKDFVYKDNYNDNLSNYLEQIGQDRRLSTKALSDSDGRYHSNWLNMMYPRLKLARNLLTDDGVIFISIDDNEVDNLKKICNEIFGEVNFIAQLIWAAGRKNDSKYISVSHEYILCYVKNLSEIKEKDTIWRERKGGLDDIYKQEANLRKIYKDDYLSMTKALKEWYKTLPNGHPAKDHKHYSKVDEKGIYFPDNISWPGGGGPDYELVNPENGAAAAVPSRGWLTKKETMLEWVAQGRVDFGEAGSVPCLKSYLRDRELSVPYSVFYQDGRASSKRIMTMFGSKVFENPKDEEIISRFTKFAVSNKDAIILDFFSGSATTAHAVMQLNAEDGGTRKYICVQIPEETPEDSEARKAGFNTISEIAKERIRRAGKKILEEQKAKNDGRCAEEVPKLDVGFKVFKLDSSNVNAWDSNPENLETTLINSLFNVKEDRTEDDLLYEILIKYGIGLTEKINRHTIAGKTVYEMGAGSLIVCLADNITTDVAEGIGKLWNDVRPKDENVKCRMVFKDSGFNGSDEMKTNTMLILKQHGITNVASV